MDFKKDKLKLHFHPINVREFLFDCENSDSSIDEDKFWRNFHDEDIDADEKKERAKAY